jgi:hypothetical protein
VHHISDYLDAAEECELALLELKEWWHAEDEESPPRLIAFTFKR